MSVAGDIQGLIQEIVSSFQNRIEEVNNLREETARMLETFKDEQGEMSIHLRETLAKAASFRKKDFDTMMTDIQARQEEREKKVKEMLADFQKIEEEIASRVKGALSRGESLRLDTFRPLMADIQARQREREEEVRQTLSDFRIEQEALNGRLNKLLAKGEQIRIKDFRAMVRDIQARQKEGKGEAGELMKRIGIEREKLEKEVKEMLGKFREEQERMRAQWQELVATLQKKRTVPTNPKRK
ncbi:hypothetical protein L6386_01375 [bacterium]|nr:hypothetical protein [bacterium]MCG2677207.1 hypothetical protein [bacterium]